MPRESHAAKSRRAVEINKRLAKAYPDAGCSLDHIKPYQLLIATILAAQCTDKRVNMVTPGLFKKYRSVKAFAEADQEELQEDIRSTGFYRNKAKSIIGACKKLVADFGGKVPADMDSLLSLPGVARKTANVVLGTGFGLNVGVVVDTHVTRLSNRMKLTTHKDNAGDKIEKDLMKLLPQKDWTMFSHRMVFHGRGNCKARKPDCVTCCVADLCPSAGKV